jgi:hypothetical protein
MFSVRDRKLLMQRIQELGETEHEQIFKMLTAEGIDHTRNCNGVFFNLSAVPDELVSKVSNFVAFCHSNKTDLDEYDKRLNECKYNNVHNNCDGGTTTTTIVAASPPRPAAAAVVRTRGLEGPAPAKTPAAPSSLDDAGRAWDAASLDKKAENAKFVQAKKKYAKRRGPDKKVDATVDLTTNTLVAEPYLVLYS